MFYQSESVLIHQKIPTISWSNRCLTFPKFNGYTFKLESSPKTPKITNTILQPTIEVINIQPKISQTIVTYNQNPQPVNEIKPHTPKRRFSLVLVPIAQAVPQTVIKLGK